MAFSPKIVLKNVEDTGDKLTITIEVSNLDQVHRQFAQRTFQDTNYALADGKISFGEGLTIALDLAALTQK